MQKKILVVFFTILLFGVLGTLYSFFNYTDNKVVSYKEYPSPSKESKTLSLTKLWINNLANHSDLKHTYPVNVLFMQVDLQKNKLDITNKLVTKNQQKIKSKLDIKKIKVAKQKTYKLVIDHVDKYSIFCVVQTLSNLNLPFVLSKEKLNPTINIASDDSKKLKRVVEELKKYKIKSKILEE